MKSILKNVMTVGAGALCLLLVTSTGADAQRRGGGRGGVSIGFRGGFGGPRFGFGFGGYRPYYGGFRYGYPGIGLSFGYLPYGYYPFYYGPDLYYGFDGVYYQQHDNSYEVVAAPVGAEVPKLPTKAKSIMINGEQYYETNGVYYKEVIHPDNTKGYLIAGKDGVLNTGQNAQPQPPRVGDIYDQLPQNCRTVTLNGKKFYVSPDDVYYEETVDNGGTTSYKVAGVPQEQDQNPGQGPKQLPPPPPAPPQQ